MINYYLRPDKAHIRIDDENKVATNVLTLGDHKFIGHITNPDYVDNMIAAIHRFTPIDQATFEAELQEAKNILINV
jgi:hypothetical protein